MMPTGLEPNVKEVIELEEETPPVEELKLPYESQERKIVKHTNIKFSADMMFDELL